MIGRKRITSRLAMCKKKNMDLEVKTQELPFNTGIKEKYTTYRMTSSSVGQGGTAVVVSHNDPGLPCAPNSGRRAR